jgi:hypothetical protein
VASRSNTRGKACRTESRSLEEEFLVVLSGGDALMFNCRSQGSDESWIMSWRYELLEEGQRLRAVERIRGGGRDQDNIWIFERR